MKVVYNQELSFEKMYDLVERREYIGAGMGASSTTMGEIIIHPGGVIPLHRHSVEDCVLLREGKGEFLIDGERRHLEAPVSILISPGEKHQITNTGTEPMRIIFAFPATNPDRELL